MLASLVSVASARDVDNSLDVDNVLLEKMGFTKDELKDLKSNPNQIGINNLKKGDIFRYINLGYTKDEISNFTQANIDYLKGKEGKLISIDEKYIRLSKDGAVEVSKKQALQEAQEYNNRMKLKQSGILQGCSQPCRDDEELSWMHMTLYVTQYGNQYELKNSFQWLTSPVWVLEDGIAISHPEFMTQVQNSEFFQYTYDRFTNDTNHSYINTNSVNKYTADYKGPNGMAFKYDILGTEFYNGSTVLVGNHRGYMTFSVTNSNPNFTTGTAYGHYSHTELGILGSIGVSVALKKLSISGALSVSPMTDTGVTFDF